MSKKELEKNKQKVQELVGAMKAKGHATNLSLENISGQYFNVPNNLVSRPPRPLRVPEYPCRFRDHLRFSRAHESPEASEGSQRRHPKWPHM